MAVNWLDGHRVCQVAVVVITWWFAAVMVTVNIRELVSQGYVPHARGKGNQYDGYVLKSIEPAFPYPFALTGILNLGAMFIAALISCVRRCWHRNAESNTIHIPLTWPEFWKLSAVGCIQGFEIGFQNAALAFLPVSARTIAGSVGILFMMASSCFWGLEHVDAMRIVSTVFIVSGGVLNGIGAEEGAEGQSGVAGEHITLGYVLVFTAQFLSSQRWSLVQKLLHSNTSGLSRITKLQMLPRIMPANTLVCIVLSSSFESPSFENVTGRTCCTFVMVSLGITTILAAELGVVHLTSALAMNVLASIHGIPMVLGGVIMLHERLRPVQVAGFAFCISGAMIYFMARAKRAAQVEEIMTPKDPYDNYDEDLGRAFVTPLIRNCSPKLFDSAF